MTVHNGDGRDRPGSRIRRRDRHGRGLRGLLVPPEVPIYRSRSERFDDLVLLAVSQLEPRWEAELAGVEFAVEEIPPAEPPATTRIPCRWPAWSRARRMPATPARPARPARIVLYRRPLMARADGDEELGELVLDVVVEEFARLLGLDPQIVDPGYPGDED